MRLRPNPLLMNTHTLTPTQLHQDTSPSNLIAPFIANLAGYGGPLAIVIGAAQAGQLSQDQTTSMLCILSLTFGLASLILSYLTRAPIITAWSTPGAAFLISALPSVSYNEAIAGFIIANGLIFIIAASGMFDTVMNKLPKSIAAALLAGILFRFGINTFASLSTETTLLLIMLCTYIIFKQLMARYATLAVLIIGCLYVFGWQHTALPHVPLHLANLSWTSPHWSLNALINIGLPLALITLTGQQITGIAVLRASGYDAQQAPAKPLVGLTALLSVLTAPLGNFGINLAAITAAICTEKTCHPDPQKRYIAGLIYGLINLIIGALAGVLVLFFLGLPKTFITILAGLALLGAIQTNLTNAFTQEHSPSDKEAALITFMTCASGVTLWHMGSAFWGILLGCATYLLFQSLKRLQSSRTAPQTK